MSSGCVDARSMPEPTVFTYPSRATLDLGLATCIAAQLRLAVRQRGVATLAVSGGSTPVGMFEQLCRQELPWKHVWLALVDDRWVDREHIDSNERLVRAYLLRERAAAARFVGWVNDASSPELGIDEALAAWRNLPEPLDVAVLGLGEDGHTASLFPCARETEAALALDCPQPLVAVHPATARHARISLTLPVLARARCLHLQIVGAAKRAVYEKALADNRLPIARVLRAGQGERHVHWAA